ncbi:MAG: threonine synthase [Tahibacter sp.]
MMNYKSTRDPSVSVTLSAAIAAGLAPDGGLYVPNTVPSVDVATFNGADTLPGIASRLLAPFFAGDALNSALPALCADAFDFPAPVQPLATPHDHILELFHGPTAAFKDFGARFLAACMSRLQSASSKPLTILVATSGDTGAAVAAAFHGRPGVRVVVLYPDGRVSPRQAHQLGCFGDNIHSYRISGSFDDCQRLVKQALNDRTLQDASPMSSANSISLGRLLPQMSYYAYAALSHYREHAATLNFVIPTGNLGNAMAGILARACGLPIGRIVLATNANDVLPQFFAGREYAPRDSVATLANAMDVGAPSNFERLRWLYSDPGELRAAFEAHAVDDPTIQRTIHERHSRYGEVHCPHTACAISVLENLRARGTSGDWCVTATAHPAKFESVVEPLIGAAVRVPSALAALLQRPAHATPLPPDYGPLREALQILA